MQTQPKTFKNREALIAHVANISPWLSDRNVSEWVGGRAEAEKRLAKIDPLHYGRTRNFIDGKITYLSPYIRHGILTLSEVRKAALKQCDDPKQIYKFIQELAWRDFWQRIYEQNPQWIWQNVEDYHTGYTHDDYADELPQDIREGKTPDAAMNYFIQDLVQTGYVHNHGRMYLAAYIVHFRRIKWQAGAKWFLHHLLDGDPASNNLSWQWVASTFSGRPYIFNLENVQKYANDAMDTKPESNPSLDATYEELNARLFPNRGKKKDD